MTKFYVESGPAFRVVVLAHNCIEAIVKALELSGSDEPLRLANVFIVNERGFVWDRENHQRYGDEIIFPTRLLLDLPEQEDRNRRTG